MMSDKRFVSVQAVGVENTSSTQCNVVLYGLDVSGRVWRKREFCTEEPWQLVSDECQSPDRARSDYTVEELIEDLECVKSFVRAKTPEDSKKHVSAAIRIFPDGSGELMSGRYDNMNEVATFSDVEDLIRALLPYVSGEKRSNG